jgi:hypothetical protein
MVAASNAPGPVEDHARKLPTYEQAIFCRWFPTRVRAPAADLPRGSEYRSADDERFWEPCFRSIFVPCKDTNA